MRYLASHSFLALLMAPLLVAPLLGTSACSSAAGPTQDDSEVGGEELPFDFVSPSLDQVTPNSIALGDTVQIFGDDFLAREYGKTKLMLSVSYTDELGDVHKYQGGITLDVKNPGVASFEFDDLFFLPTKDRVGIFDGEAYVITELDRSYQQEDEDSERSSESINVALQVLPSLGVVQLRSVSEDGCAQVTKATIGDQELALNVMAIGVPDATPDNPIKFRVQFSSEDLHVVYVSKSGFDVWPIPQVDPAISASAEGSSSRFDVEVSDGNMMVVDPTWRKDSVSISPPVQIGQELVSEVYLQRLSTAPSKCKSKVTAIMVEAFLPDGSSLRRLIPYKINEEWAVQSYDQNIRLMERSDPIPVSGCFAGGDIGRELSYTEGTSVTQSRSLSFRWDQNVANMLGVSGGIGGLLPVQLMVNQSSTFSETFGIDINETVSSESHVGINFSAHIIPGYFGTCFRQVDKIQREVDVVYNNACGVSGVIGQTLLTDWNFGFDIATGPSCDVDPSLEDGGNYEPEGIEY